MPTFIDVDDFPTILDEPDARRRTRLICRLYRDFERLSGEPGVAAAITRILRAAARDPEPRVRRAFARFVARSPLLPAAIAEHLARDLPPVACPVLEHSTVLGDGFLVDIVAAAGQAQQIAVARRATVSAPLAAAIIEVGSAPACSALLRNIGASLPRPAFDRVEQRFPRDPEVGAAVLGNAAVPFERVEAHLTGAARKLESFVTGAGWLDPRSAGITSDTAVAQAFATYLNGRPQGVVDRFVRRLARERRIGAPFIIRAATLGADNVVETAFAAAAGLPAERIRAILADRGPYALASLCARIGFDEADLAKLMRARGSNARPGGGHRLGGTQMSSAAGPVRPRAAPNPGRESGSADRGAGRPRRRIVPPIESVRTAA